MIGKGGGGMRKLLFSCTEDSGFNFRREWSLVSPCVKMVTIEDPECRTRISEEVHAFFYWRWNGPTPFPTSKSSLYARQREERLREREISCHYGCISWWGGGGDMARHQRSVVSLLIPHPEIPSSSTDILYNVHIVRVCEQLNLEELWMLEG